MGGALRRGVNCYPFMPWLSGASESGLRSVRAVITAGAGLQKTESEFNKLNLTGPGVFSKMKLSSAKWTGGLRT